MFIKQNIIFFVLLVLLGWEAPQHAGGEKDRHCLLLEGNPFAVRREGRTPTENPLQLRIRVLPSPSQSFGGTDSGEDGDAESLSPEDKSTLALMSQSGCFGAAGSGASKVAVAFRSVLTNLVTETSKKDKDQ